MEIQVLIVMLASAFNVFLWTVKCSMVSENDILSKYLNMRTVHFSPYSLSSKPSFTLRPVKGLVNSLVYI